eukprot:CAMPEP_0172427330 /NCGR_PEP_ID=MMETSP1064-20121228/41706_1 /TAXON_ID=202472 /ORGANISM="Aulacoseira subarctica , Strain CCAP 1002/5" /LENGTH=442 /DNA_ID=CAMNT_0013171499 /DNA_START=225 /DNA_END=1553 /DNA_ORIENTATION=-
MAAPFVAQYTKRESITDRTTLPLSSHKSFTVAEQAADSLLSLTSSPKFLQAVSELYPHQVHPGGNELNSRSCLTAERLRLHESFLKVTQWCLLSVSATMGHSSQKEASQLVHKAMELAIRGEKLGLPPHIPLYNQLAVACGVHIGASAVLKLADSLQRMLFPSSISLNQPRVFDSCIRTMTYFGHYKELVHLLQGLQEEHDLDIRRDLAIELTQKIKYHRFHGMYNEEDMLAFSRILKNSASNSVSKKYKQLKQELSTSLVSAGMSEARMSDLNILLDDVYRSMNLTSLEEDTYYEVEEEESFSSDGTLVDTEELESIDDLWDDDETIPVSSSAKNAMTASLVRPRIPGIPNVSLEPKTLSVQDLHYNEFKKGIYVRDTTTWFLPDIVDAILETTGKSKIVYSREFEEEIIRQIEEETDELDDDEYFDDGDDEDEDDGSDSF